MKETFESLIKSKNGNIVFNGFGEIEKHIERSLKN